MDGSKLTGTLHYLDDYTGFDSELYEGNYICLHAESEDSDSITVEVINGTLGHPVTLDADGLAVLRITNKNTQKIRFVSTGGGQTRTKTFDLSGLTLETE